MSEKKMKQWYVQVEWEDGTTEQLHAFHLPDCVTEEIETHIKDLEDYHNGGWDMAYETGWEDDSYENKETNNPYIFDPMTDGNTERPTIKQRLAMTQLMLKEKTK